MAHPFRESRDLFRALLAELGGLSLFVFDQLVWLAFLSAQLAPKDPLS